MPPKPGIGRAELELLCYIQEHHPVTVREAGEHLARTKGQTRTTALNMMERLREKGHLTREKREGVYHYSPSQPRPQLLRSLVRDFVEGALGGSVEPFVAYLIQEASVDEAQLRELRELVQHLEAQQDGPAAEK
jgi:predicted transcriptional regulator